MWMRIQTIEKGYGTNPFSCELAMQRFRKSLLK
jgi:hypothetical protein